MSQEPFTDQYDAPATMEVYRPYCREPFLRLEVRSDGADGVRVLIENDKGLPLSVEQSPPQQQ